MSDKSKLSVVWIALILAFVAWILPAQYYALNPNLADNYRLTSIAVALIVALLSFWFTETRNKFFHLLRDSKIELAKVVWPTKQEITTYYITVLIFSIAVALYTYFIDIVVEWVLYQGILG